MEQGALKEALRKLLQARRAQLDPHALGVERPAQGRRPAGGGLSQREVDDLLGFGRGTIERLENGRLHNAPDHVLKKVGELYNLDPHEWVWLWRMTWRRDPPFPLRPDTEETIPASWQWVLDGQPHPAYLTNHRWEVVAYNKHLPSIFPDEQVPENTMEWMLLSPEARDILGDWGHQWAPFVAPHLWAARAAHPNDEYLADLERRILADKEASPIYQDFGPIFVHPDGACRPFNHPTQGAGWVTMLTSIPRSSPRFVTMLMVFTPGAERPEQKPPLRARYLGK